MANASRRPRTEIVWVLDKVDQPTIRRARRLVYAGRPATDPDTARVAMALAHKAEAEPLGAVGAICAGTLAVMMLALGLGHETPAGGLASRVIACATGAYLLAMVPWQIRLSAFSAPRAELANRTFLKRAGAPYQPLSGTASIRLAPIRLVVLAGIYLVPMGLGLGVIIASIAHRPAGGLTSIVAAGAPAAIIPAVTAALKSRHAWKPAPAPGPGPAPAPAPANGGRRFLGRRADRRA